MNRPRWAFAFALFTLAGCNQVNTPENVNSNPPEPRLRQSPAAAVSLADVKLSDEEIANIKKLPELADQQAAMDQKICAVNEEDGKPVHLGAMDVPIKEVVKGKTVFLCCKGCERELKADPDKFLARIGK